MTICQSCGNQLVSGTKVCPHCGAEQPSGSFVEKVQDSINAFLATSKTHPKHWMIGGGVAVAAIAAAIVVFGGFLGPSGRQICTATLTLAKDYGVISPSAELSSSSAKSTDVDGRKSCTASAGSDTFKLLADVKKEDSENKPCKDYVKQSGCVKLYSVARSDGMTSYQVREIPPDETDEALAAKSPPPPPPNAAAPGAAPAAAAPGASPDSGGLDADTAVDNSAGNQGPSQPQQ